MALTTENLEFAQYVCNKPISNTVEDKQPLEIRDGYGETALTDLAISLIERVEVTTKLADG